MKMSILSKHLNTYTVEMRCNIRYSAATLSPKRAWVRNPSNSALTGDSSDMKLDTTDKREKTTTVRKCAVLTLFPLQKSYFPLQCDPKQFWTTKQTSTGFPIQQLLALDNWSHSPLPWKCFIFCNQILCNLFAEGCKVWSQISKIDSLSILYQRQK